jgi:hypothetical protein
MDPLPAPGAGRRGRPGRSPTSLATGCSLSVITMRLDWVEARRQTMMLPVDRAGAGRGDLTAQCTPSHFGQESGLIRREHALVNQLLAEGYAVVEIDAQGRDGCPAHRSAAHKARALPAEVTVPLVAPRIK